jgi:hypothetical protein
MNVTCCAGQVGPIKLLNGYGPNGVIVILLTLLFTGTAHAQLFVSNPVSPAPVGYGSIGEYTLSGATVKASLVSDSNVMAGIAVAGSNLFVVNSVAGTIGEYTGVEPP